MRLLFLLLPLLLLAHADEDPAPGETTPGDTGDEPGPDPPGPPVDPGDDTEDPPEPIAPVPRFPKTEDFRDIHVKTRFVHNDNVVIKHYEEFFDFNTKKGRLDVMVEGIPNEVESVSSFYAKGKNELIEIRTKNQNVSCKVETIDPLKMNPITDLIDYDPVEQTVYYGPMAIWRWVVRRMNGDKPLNQIHGTNGSLRGRDVWFYEFEDTEKEVDVNINMYFIDSPDAVVDIPIQFEIKGSQDGVIVSDRYEFLLIEDYLSEDTEIAPEIGAGCVGIRETDVFPRLVGKMGILSAPKVGFNVEIVEQLEETNVLYSHRMVMDNFDKLLYLTSKEGDNEITFIEDLQRGITYVQVNGEECEADPLESRFVKNSHSLSFAKGMKEILNLDGNDFYELGVTSRRGISVQVFERVIWDHRFTTFDESAEGVRYKKAVITHFLTDNLDVDLDTNSVVPVQTLLTGYEENENGLLVKRFTQEINYFEFREIRTDDINSEVFDVSNCFPNDKDRNHFDLFLKTEGHAGPDHSFALIERMVARQIAEGTDISILRVPHVEVTSAGHFSSKEGSGLVLNVLLLEKPSLMLYFRNMSVTLKPHKGDEKVDSVTQKDCARMAIQKNAAEIGSCSGFFFCGETCFLTDWTLSDEGRDSLEEDPGTCTFYQRNVMNSKNLSSELSLKEVTQLLFDLSASGELFFTLGEAEGTSRTYTVDNLMLTRPRQELVESRSFAQVIPQHSLVESEKTVTISGRTVMSIGDCESACDQEAAMLCESFAFCQASGTPGKCILSPETVTKSFADITETSSCDIYSRTYKSLFIEVDGGIAQADSDKVQQISDLEECARTCSSLTDFKCQSFAFCGTSHCVLHAAHAFATQVSEAKEKQDDIECDLFTLKHFSDYVPTANLIVGGDALQTHQKLSVDECAARCGAQKGCRSVNYCHESAKTPVATCSLMSQSPTDAGASRNRHPGCWNYRRLSVPADPPPPPGYRGARLTWLVIGMIITGAVLGIAALLAYGHVRSRSGRSAESGGLGLSIPSVRWSRQKDEE